MITIDDFMNVELRLAEVKEVKEHSNADRLYVVKIDTGGEERQLVAGIRKAYTPEELVGKQVVFVANLEPATIRGEESQGMILAVSDDENLSVLTTEKKIKLGSRIK